MIAGFHVASRHDLLDPFRDIRHGKSPGCPPDRTDFRIFMTPPSWTAELQSLSFCSASQISYGFERLAG